MLALLLVVIVPQTIDTARNNEFIGIDTMYDYNEIMFLAKTIYGESRGEGEESWYKVGWTIKNRVEKEWRGKTSFKEVVLDSYQFSCWNEGDPNRTVIENPSGKTWSKIFDVAIEIYYSDSRENTFQNIYHYHDTSIVEPYWGDGLTMVTFEESPKFVFYKGTYR